MQRSVFARIFRASITNERDLVRYVVVVSAICGGIALGVDVTNQLVFFIDGDKACTPMPIPVELIAMMRDVATDTINHESGGL